MGDLPLASFCQSRAVVMSNFIFCRYVYWADLSTEVGEAFIAMADMNGQNSRKVVTQGLVQPTGMAIDFANYDSVFWVDQKLNILQGMLADGSKVKTLARGGETVTLLSQSLSFLSSHSSYPKFTPA